MTYTWTYTVGTIEEADQKWFNEHNEGFKCTGETLEERYEESEGRDSGSTTYVVMKATGRRFTPYQMCRDCGDHYIIAKWDKYIRIDKGTMKKTVDVEDI